MEGMKVDAEVLVRDYLDRLEEASWPLAPPRRAELVGEVREHIDTALSEAGRRDEVTVRNVLDRLGPPEEIVSLETASSASDATSLAPEPAEAAATGSQWGAIEIIALLLLTVGAVLLPFIGPLLGLVFVWASDRWTRQEKLIASAIVALLLLPILLLLGGALGLSAGSGAQSIGLSSPMPAESIPVMQP